MSVDNNSVASESSGSIDSPGRLDLGEGSVGFEPNDVLNGRNKLSFNHIGNRRFREVVSQSIDDYNSSRSRAEKYGIVESIMSHVAKSGGRFLKQLENGTWQELEPETVRQKIAHAIRDVTKKRGAKLKRAASQVESSTNLAPLVMPHVAEVTRTIDTSSNREPRRQSAPEISAFLEDLNKHMQQNRTVTGEGHMPPLTGLKDLKQLMMPSQPLPSKHGLGIVMPNPIRNELRQELAQDMGPGTGINFRGDLSQIGPDLLFNLGQQAKPAPSFDQGASPACMGLGLEELGLHQQSSLPDLCGVQEQRSNLHPDPRPFFGMDLEPIYLEHLHQPDVDDDNDDEFMAIIDDTLGPWQPEPEPDSLDR